MNKNWQLMTDEDLRKELRDLSKVYKTAEQVSKAAKDAFGYPYLVSILSDGQNMFTGMAITKTGDLIYF